MVVISVERKQAYHNKARIHFKHCTKGIVNSTWTNVKIIHFHFPRYSIFWSNSFLPNYIHMYMHTFGGMGLTQKNIYRKINDSMDYIFVVQPLVNIVFTKNYWLKVLWPKSYSRVVKSQFFYLLYLRTHYIIWCWNIRKSMKNLRLEDFDDNDISAVFSE